MGRRLVVLAGRIDCQDEVLRLLGLRPTQKTSHAQVELLPHHLFEGELRSVLYSAPHHLYRVV